MSEFEAVLPALDLSTPLLALASAALLGFLVGIVPVGLAEVLAVAIGAVEPPGLAVGMLALFTLTHVAAKALWYWIGVHADRIRHERTRQFIARARVFLAEHPGFGLGVLGSSAVLSVPPFHLAAIAAGLVRIPFGRFVATCLAGRAIRFGVLGGAVTLIRHLLG